jgi:hypothetical protein
MKEHTLRVFGATREELEDTTQNCIMRSFVIFTAQIKGDEMHGSCSTHGRNKKSIQNVNL